MEKKWRLLPYETDYEFLQRCRKHANKFLWAIGILSVTMQLINGLSGIFNIIYIIIKLIDIVLIVGYYVLNVVTEIFLYPKTANKRRMGLVDNSFGSKYLGKPTKGYYSNDDLKLGIYKFTVNIYESCLFTYNISKRMTPQVVIKNVVSGIVFIILIYFGGKNNMLLIPILQIILSSLFVTELIHQLNFVSKLERLIEQFKDLYSNYQKTSNVKIYEDISKEIMLDLEYETILAYNKAPLSDKIYNEIRIKLTDEWERIKVKYGIIKSGNELNS